MGSHCPRDFGFSCLSTEMLWALDALGKALLWLGRGCSGFQAHSELHATIILTIIGMGALLIGWSGDGRYRDLGMDARVIRMHGGWMFFWFRHGCAGCRMKGGWTFLWWMLWLKQPQWGHGRPKA